MKKTKFPQLILLIPVCISSFIIAGSFVACKDKDKDNENEIDCMINLSCLCEDIGNEKSSFKDIENLCKTWVLIEKTKNDITEVMFDIEDRTYVVEVTLTFSPTNGYRGRCDNNTYYGKFEISDNDILFCSLGATDGMASDWYRDYISIIVKGGIMTNAVFKLFMEDENVLLLSNTDSVVLKFISREIFEETYYELPEIYNHLY